MSGEFILEDKNGKVILATSPGMDTPSRSKSTPKRTPGSTKRVSRRTAIPIFSELASTEIEKDWIDKFEKMALSKFPRKISWSPSSDKGIYGELIYNKQTKESIKVRSDIPLDDVRDIIKTFVNNYTNFQKSSIEQTSAHLVLDEPMMEPPTWGSLKPKDQVSLIKDFITRFSLDNGLTPAQRENLHKYILVFSICKPIKDYIVYEDGIIKDIHGIYQTSNGSFRLKNPNS